MPPPVATLVDTSIFVFRAWFSRGEQPDLHGRPGGAVHGFVHSLCQWLEHCPPGPLVFAFDNGLRSGFRHRLYPLYKAHRPPAPEALRDQFRRIRGVLDSLGLAHCQHPEYEADDLIASLAATARVHGARIDVLSADKDLTQVILGPEDRLLDPERGTCLTRKDLERRMRIRPDQVADMLALAGDRADNVPGLAGVGPTTAARILRRLGSLEAILAAPAEVARCNVRGAVRIAEQVAARPEALRLARRLTGLVTDIVEVPAWDTLAPRGALLDAEDQLQALGVAAAYRPRLQAIATALAAAQWPSSPVQPAGLPAEIDPRRPRARAPSASPCTTPSTPNGLRVP